MACSREDLFARRKQRTRRKLRKVSGLRPRLSVFRSSKHIYAQIIDDVKGADGRFAPRRSMRKPKKTLDKGKSADTKAAAAGRQARRRTCERRSASPTWSSIAAVTSITAESKRLGDAAREGGLNF